MALRKIITTKKPYKDIPEVLTKGTQDFKGDFASSDFKILIRDMKKTMHVKDGVGLAAPQINVSYKICVIATIDNDMVLVNPRIVWFSRKKESMEEGCLSVPDLFCPVTRAFKIKVKAYNEKGEKIKFKAEGMMARVIQHEVDHLNGILILKHCDKNK
ncbi:MAG: peptide deformylase [bacterium]